MRIRQIKPAFWSDSTLAELPESVRLFYIGTWQLADDGGWMEWNPSEIAVALYPYISRGRRERMVQDRANALVQAGRLLIDPCGQHAFVPHLTEHQHFGGRPVYSTRDAHARGCARLRADDRSGKVGYGTVGKGKGDGEETSVIPYHRQAR